MFTPGHSGSFQFSLSTVTLALILGGPEDEFMNGQRR
jgi:hypothetical protein